MEQKYNIKITVTVAILSWYLTQYAVGLKCYDEGRTMNKFLKSFKKDIINHAKNKCGNEQANEIWMETEKNI